MTPDYNKWNIIISKKSGKKTSHFGKRGEERGLISKGHCPSMAQVRRALDSKNCVFLDADENCLKSVFKDRGSINKMKYWTMVFKPNPNRKSVYIITVREANNEEPDNKEEKRD